VKTTTGRCLSCRRWQTWPGGHAERPPCPDCGAEPDRELGELLDAELARIEESSRTERRQREAAKR